MRNFCRKDQRCQWRYDRITNQVVDEGRASGARKAEPRDLQRRRTICEHWQQRVVGRALQVDQDVDAEVAHALRDAFEAASAQLFEMLDRVDDATPQRAAVVRTGRQQGEFERAAIVALEHLHHQLAGRMLVEVGDR